MELANAKVLLAVCEDYGVKADIYEEYSGRGMYGATTTGLVVESTESLLSAVLKAVADDHIDVEGMTREVRGYTADNMGMDTIIY